MPACLPLPTATVQMFIPLPASPPLPGATRAILGWLVLATVGWLPSVHAAASYPQADPTGQEQYLLQKLNRARIDPVGEGQRLADWLRNTEDGRSVVSYYKIDPAQVQSAIAAFPAVSPLVFNANLGAAARGHSTDLVVNNISPDSGLAHTGSDGSSPGSRDRAAGFTQGVTAENVGIGVDSLDNIHAGYFVDWGNPDFGHRKNSFSGYFGTSMVGVGVVVAGDGTFTETEDFGYPNPSFNGSTLTTSDNPAYLTGVVYRDSNGNGQYDVGEGVAGATVTVQNGSYYAVTSASGGYSLPLVSTDGVNMDGNVSVAVRFSDGTMASKTVAVTRLDSGNGSYRSNVEWDVAAGGAATTSLPTFFDGAASLDQGWNYLAFANGNAFGYYNTTFSPFLLHLDLGWQYAVDAQDSRAGVYLYDFQSGAWWYTSPGFPFPYLYDFARQSILYYYPADGRPGFYSSAPRYFYDFAAGQIITL